MTADLRLGLAGCQAGLEPLPLPEAMAFLEFAETRGLDGVWVNEEHLASGRLRRVCWSTLPFLAFVAGRVPRIRLGTAALLLPLHHPLRIAEEIASLCEFAPGRVAVGVAPHRPGPYTDAFGAPEERIREDFATHLDLVRRLLGGEVVDIDAAHHRGRAASSLVVPAVAPRFYRAAFSPASIRAAAETGMPLVQHYIQAPPAVLRGREIVRGQAGERAQGLLRDSPVHRFVLLAEDEAEARRRAREPAQVLTGLLRSFGMADRPDVTDDRALRPETFVRETALVGTPESVAARVRELAAECGTETINLNLGWMGTMPAESVRATGRLLVDELLPAVSPPDRRRDVPGRDVAGGLSAHPCPSTGR
ncbi:LLM class flavin-dependent oxidoreductase [Pseudonocardia hispaniensis]|uniref:LLM class flavin-dependent oxidoreductase n=1 Tax=Pseudonocardia hispaniensis TaxID=904933 RepID=A0ABW1J864_9PSEU